MKNLSIVTESTKVALKDVIDIFQQELNSRDQRIYQLEQRCRAVLLVFENFFEAKLEEKLGRNQTKNYENACSNQVSLLEQLKYKLGNK